MATTYQPNKNIGEPAYGDPGWATTLNNSFSNIDSGFGGNQIFNLSSASGTISVSGTTPTGVYPGTPSFIPLSWTLSTPTTALAGNVVLQLPSGIGGQWTIYNNCTQGSYTITVSAVGGSTSVTLASGAQIVYSDGLGNVRLSNPTEVTSSNNQIIYNSSGALTGSNNLTYDGQSLTVTGAIQNITGGTLSGTAATLNFAGPVTYIPGDYILVSGATPTGINGSYVVTGSTSTSVTYANTTTGSVSAAGTITPTTLNLSNGNAILGGTLNVGSTTTLGGNTTVSGTLAMASSFLRNRLINGAMQVDQRNAGSAQTITAGAALAYTVDRWYAYCTGANVTGQRVAGTLANTYNYRFTGATSVTAISFAQRIEAINSADLAGSTVTLSAYLSNSLLTTVTWTAYYANTTDAFGTIASPTVTQIATGTFTVNSTLSRYSVQINIPSAATTGLQIVFSVGAQTSGTWVIGSVQLEAGSVATPLERPTIQQILAMCQRYYETISYAAATFYCTGSSEGFSTVYRFAVLKRAAPTISTTYNTSSCTVTATSYVDQVNFGATTTSGPIVANWGTTSIVTASAEL